MKKITLYQVDAFTDHLFGGNPAGVCPLDEWLPEEMMQNLAMENNLAETAFFVREGEGFHIRWFTPVAEVDLCGHATLASSHVLFQHLHWNKPEIHFQSRSGLLTIKKENDLLTLNFPSDNAVAIDPPTGLLESLSIDSKFVWKGKTDYLILLPNQEDVEMVTPDFGLLGKTDCRGVMITAPGRESDFVSRFFAPKVGVNEDPVTGSAHTTLIPFWADRLGKTELTAIQLSKRKGHLWCKYLGDRVEISGRAVTYLVGEVVVSNEQ